MKYPFILLLLLAAATQGFTQDTTTRAATRDTTTQTPAQNPSIASPLKVRIRSIQGQHSTGSFGGITDTSIRFTDNRTYSYHNMETISFYRKGGVGRSTLIGLAIGAGAGLLFGLASGDDDPNQWFAMSAAQKAVGGAVVFGGIGTIVGFITGALKPKGFHINGRKERYDRMRAKMTGRLDIN